MRASLIAAAAGLSLNVNAHIFISSPPPIEGTAIKSPLDASGSNFPCHGVTLPTSGGQPMAAGSSQSLAWDTGDGANTAVHGGGSCQISLTYETDPAQQKDPANWHVIYSIEGGCPSFTYQNLDGSYQGPQGAYTGSWPCTDPRTNGIDCVNAFNFTIPKGLKNGHAIMSWTWFNTVGNREIYQNCINTEITGGDSSEMDELPAMFVANLASVDQCPTTQSVNLEFPFPGKYVTTPTPTVSAARTASTYSLAKPTGQSCAADGQGGSSGSSGSGAGASASPAQPSAAVPQPTSAAAAAAGSSAGLGLGTLTTMMTAIGSSSSSAAAAPAIQAPSAPAAAAAPPPAASSAAPAVSAVAPAPPAASAAAPASPSSGTCDETHEGLYCSGDGTQFGMCSAGSIVWQPVAAGTKCVGSQIAFAESSGARRHRRHARAHVLRGAAAM